MDFISEAAVIGIPEATKGEVPYAFVILKEGVEENSEHKLLANKHVAKVIAKFAVPQGSLIFSRSIFTDSSLDTIMVSGLPKTRSGKIMRRILRKLASSEAKDFAHIAPELGDISTLAEPEVVKEIFLKKCQS